VIDAERWAEARRLRRVEGYSIRAISRRLKIARKTVRKILKQTSFPESRRQRRKRGSIFDPFKKHARRYLEESEEELSGVQIFELLRTRHGYPGEITLVRNYLRELRKSGREAFLTLSFLPAECMQVDWGHYGYTTIERTKRRVSAFVAVLAYSRLLYVELTLSERMDAFLEAHERAFQYFGGVAKRCLYDNCKTVVVQRLGDGIRFNSKLLEYAGHCLFKPRPCPPRKPWHKGRVESGIGYLRKGFLRGRRSPIEDLERERRELSRWRDQVANLRIHRVTRRKPRELFEEVERAALLPLPEHPYDTAHVDPSVTANKYYRVPFDGNRYSVPYQLAHRTGLVLRATTTHVEVYRQGELVARHLRSYERGKDVRDNAHDRGLREKKRRADRDLLLGRFVSALGPEAEAYASGLACEHVRAALHIRKILGLVERYDSADVRQALLRALEYKAFGADYVENILHQERRRRLLQPAVPPPTIRDPRLARISLSPPDLSRLDHLFPQGDPHALSQIEPKKADEATDPVERS
jgi:transposase